MIPPIHRAFSPSAWRAWSDRSTVQTWERLHDAVWQLPFAIGPAYLITSAVTGWRGFVMCVMWGIAWPRLADRLIRKLGRTPFANADVPVLSVLCRLKSHDTCAQIESARLACACHCHKAYV